MRTLSTRLEDEDDEALAGLSTTPASTATVDEMRAAGPRSWGANYATPVASLPGASVVRPGTTPPAMQSGELVARPGSRPLGASSEVFNAANEGERDPIAQVAEWTEPEGQRPITSSRFVSFGQLMGLNSEKARTMAQRLASRVQEQARASRSATKAASDRFTTGTNQALGASQLYGGQTVEAPYGGQTGRTGVGRTGSLQQGLMSETPGAITPAEARARAARPYSGPTGLEGYDALAQGADAAQQAAQALGTDEGVDAQLEGGRWDAALGRAAGAGTFNDLRTRYAGLLGETENAQTAAARRAESARGRVADSARQWGAKAGDAELLAAQDERRGLGDAQVYEPPTMPLDKWLGDISGRTGPSVSASFARDGVDEELYQAMTGAERNELRALLANNPPLPNLGAFFSGTDRPERQATLSRVDELRRKYRLRPRGAT